jgi:hypothetical protein
VLLSGGLLPLGFAGMLLSDRSAEELRSVVAREFAFWGLA